MSKKTDEREILYSFWKNLPVLRIVTIQEEEVFGHDARTETCRFLRYGLTEEINGEQRKRYAFNAREILQYLQETKQIKITLQSLYFHLQKLEEYGLTQNITIIREGRHNTAYTGRTARFFLFVDPEEEYNKYLRRFTAMFGLVQLENPEIQLERAEKFLNEFLEIKRERQKQLSEWLVQKESLITQGELNLTDLFGFLELIDANNPKFLKLFKEIAEYLKLDLWF
ncbi:MAG: winged helix-turn-helix domain-containing protein [Candidatus Hermodarchaeota archaeon]